MVIKIVEYKIKEGALFEVKKAIETFVAAIAEYEPETFYEAFRRGDSEEFIHLMKFTSEKAEETHAKAPYTSEFVKTLYPLCQEEPIFANPTMVE